MSRRIRLVFLFLAVLAGPLAAQQNKSIDSLLLVIRSMPGMKPDTNKIKALNALSFQYKNSGDYKKGLECANEAVVLVYKFPLPLTPAEKSLLGNAYSTMGLIYFRKGDFGQALTYQEKALQLREATGNKKDIASSLGSLGVIYNNQGIYAQALDKHFAALKLRDDIKDKSGVASSLGNIGEVYRLEKEYDKALDYYTRSLKMAQEVHASQPSDYSNNQVIGNALNNIGLIHEDRGEFRQALQRLQESLKVREEMGDKKLIASSLNNIGLIYIRLGENEKALDQFSRSLEIKEATGDKKGIAASYVNLGMAYLKQKNFPVAKEYLVKSLALARSIKANDVVVEAEQNLAELNDATGNIAEAYRHFRAYISVRDSQLNEENTKRSVRSEMNYIYLKRMAADSLRNAEQINFDRLKSDQAISQQRTYTYGGLAGFVLMLVVALVSFRAYRQKQRANSVIAEQKTIVEEKQKEILDSIHYAQRIQGTLLAHESFLQQQLPGCFVFFRPKDIVSGDFYWATQQENRLYIAVCDSTGHGVPGAFMSLLNISFLNEAITEKNISEPQLILDYVRERLIASVSHDGAQDGMDGILLSIDPAAREITYAAAHNAPLLVSGGELLQLPADKMPVGKGERAEPFTGHRISWKSGDWLYLYTDGFADQFGGPKGKKYKYKTLNALLAACSVMPGAQQKEKLGQEFSQWRGTLEQVDDVLVMGIRL